jgi:hypothetical protein
MSHLDIGQIKRATKRPASPISKHGPPGRLLLDLYIHMHRTKLPRDLSATKLALNDIPAKQFYKRGKESLLPTVNMVSEARQVIQRRRLVTPLRAFTSRSI